jgi:hypothetical protein
MNIENPDSNAKDESPNCNELYFWIWIVVNSAIVIYAIILFICVRKFQREEFISDVRIKIIFFYF